MVVNLGINPLADFRNPVSVGVVHAGFGGESEELVFVTNMVPFSFVFFSFLYSSLREVK